MSIGNPIDRMVDAVAAGGGAGGIWFFLRWALRWFTERSDKRQQQLDSEHAALNMSWKEYRLFLEKRMSSLERQNRAVLSAFQHVSAGLIRRDPQAPELLVAERLMAAAFPTDFTMAGQMAGAAVDMSGGMTA